jgi:UDP-GlcNAc:undecaprenyl-phosphate GlcNAc-1-phosphate transferase
MIISGICFVFALLVGVLLTPMVIAWSGRGHGLDHPDPFRKRHAIPISRLGGIPLMLVCIGAVGYAMWRYPGSVYEWGVVLGGCLLMFGLGLWDDFKPLGAKKKLAGQFAVALLVYALGLRIEMLTYPVGHFSLDLGWLGFWMTLFWLIAVPNIVNLIDGIDGLAAGLGMFLFVTLGFVGWSGGQMDIAWVSFAMAGVLVGFLCYNFPPARIFLGDGGAYLVGFAVAAFSLKSSHKGSVAAALFVMVVALGVPIIDTIYALLRRGLRGFPLFRADAEHIHHRLQDLGLSKRRVVLGLYLICATLSVMGLSVLWSQGRSLPIAAAVLFLMGIAGVRYLGYIGSWGDLADRWGLVMSRRFEVRYALLQSRVLEMELQRTEEAESYMQSFRDALQKVGFELRDEVEREGEVRVEVEFPGYDPLVLIAPQGGRDLRHWQRLAECFRDPYLKALMKWNLQANH